MRIYSQKMVARRFIPFVVALAVAFAPVALEACQASCLSHEAEAVPSAASHHHHSHAEPASAVPVTAVHGHHTQMGAPASGPVITAQSRPCDHGDDLPVVAAALGNAHVAPAIVIAGIRILEIHEHAAWFIATAVAPSSQQLTLTTQLRV